jgi:hypothetical protein
MRRHALRRENVQSWDGLRSRQVGGDQKIEEGVDEFGERVGAIVAVDYDYSVALGALPQ